MIDFMLYFFFFKQKTAYEMRISDWSSDVCSSDLAALAATLQEFCFGLEACEDVRRCALVPVELDVLGDRAVRIDAQRAHRTGEDETFDQIGRASCRERVCQYV